MLALGSIKSEILKILNHGSYEVRLPKWSPFYQTHQGVFVGTSLDGKTNCSYGRYETNSKEKTATKIVEAAGDCVSDAKNRWHIPYKVSNVDKLTYKLELLEPKQNWKKYDGKDISQHFKMNGKQGIYFTITI